MAVSVHDATPSTSGNSYTTSVDATAHFPARPEMQVSHETIYQALYVQGRGELRRELTRALRTITVAYGESAGKTKVGQRDRR
jgi:IS30 family transposase